MLLVTKVHNALQAEDDVGAMSRRIRLLEEDYEQTAVRLTTASGKLEEASKFAEESERYATVVDLTDTQRRCTAVLSMQSFQRTVT